MKPLVPYLTSNLDLSTRPSLGAAADTDARNYQYAGDRVEEVETVERWLMMMMMMHLKSC